jgi:tether containing UBX domain for GLUT4
MENGGASGAGRMFYEMPALNIMGRELSTFGDLQKTLAQLGFNGGSCLIRLSFTQTKQPLDEAMVEIGKYFKEEEATAETTIEGASGKAAVVKDEGVALSLPAGEDTDMADDRSTADPSPYPETVGDAPLPISNTSTQPTQASILGPDQRPVQVFLPPSSATPKAVSAPHNEKDYEPTFAHAAQFTKRMEKSSVNKKLESYAEEEKLEKEKAEKLAQVKEVQIKIRFPDQSSIVTTFTGQDTGAGLYSYVASVIFAEDQPFKLVYSKGSKGPQTVPRNEKKLIKDIGFEKRELVNFNWEEGASNDARKRLVLKAKYVDAAQEIVVPEVPGAGKEDEKSTKDDKGRGKATGGGAGIGSGKKMPAWLKLPGKK